MRIKLTLTHDCNAEIPIDYRYFVSSWFYKQLAKIDYEYAHFLHNKGYSLQCFNYKYFCFSDIINKNTSFEKQTNKLKLREPTSKIIFSIYLEKASELFVKSLFANSIFEIPFFDAEISKVEILPSPIFQKTMQFKTVSPTLFRGTHYKKSDLFLSPQHELFLSTFKKNCLNKHKAMLESSTFNFDDIDIKLIEYKGKTRLCRIKQMKMKGFYFSFEISAPIEILKSNYYGGFGSQNASLGFGLVDEI